MAGLNAQYFVFNIIQSETKLQKRTKIEKGLLVRFYLLSILNIPPKT